VIFRSANDVSAVVLSTGEPSTQQAIDSLHRQTVPVRDIIVVREVAPFHKALNVGAAQVRTSFFIQVDADMVLDSHCVAGLRRGMRRHVGIVVGHLRDPLVEQVVGVKLFRTACFNFAQFPDSISPDTDFVDAIARAGWNTAYIGRRWRGGPHPWHSFGEHRPNYTPAYTYRKFLLEGRRYRYRQRLDGLRWLLDRLAAGRHPAALIAQIALARGFFVTDNRDDLCASASDDEFTRVEDFLSAATHQQTRSGIDLPADLPAGERFHAFFRLAHELFEARDLTTFKNCMDPLDQVAHNDASLVAKIALCMGLCTPRGDISDAAIEAHHRTLASFLANDGLLSGGVAQTESVVGSNLPSIATHAAKIGLTQFVVEGPRPAEYRMDQSSDSPTCRLTERTVTSTIDARGRPRIKAPFSPFGHVIFTQAERASSIFFCFDLLRSGYVFAYLPTSLGPQRVLLASQLAKNCLSRVGLPSRSASGAERRAITLFPKSGTAHSLKSPEVYRRVGDYSRFGAQGLSRREVFGHLAIALPKPYPDSQLLLEKSGMPPGVLKRGRFVQINLYTTDFYDLPDELFWDPEVNWHHQQFGLKGLIAAAGLWIQDQTVTITTLQSDLCQQLYRHKLLRNVCKTQVETHFKYWYAILFNAVLDFCVATGQSIIYSPTGEQIVRNTTQQIVPDLFLRIYNYPGNRYICRRTTRNGAEYWEVPVTANTARIARLRPEAIAPQQKETRPQICLFHDIEENVDTDISAGECADNLRRMLAIEKDFGVVATYNVLGTLFERKRTEILASNPQHSIGFHSFDHRINDLNQLPQCRNIDLRVKGYRPPRSDLTAELTDYNLTRLNFEWFACSAHRLGFDAYQLENGLVKIPIALDDYPLFTGTVGYDQWMCELLGMSSERAFFAFSLHDCYASHWLEHYARLLDKLAAIGDFINADVVCDRMFLPGASAATKLAQSQGGTSRLQASLTSQLHA
jgi:hypothetical protein